MALVDTDALLQPVSAESPTGKNLEYEPEYSELERSAQGKGGGGMVSAKGVSDEPEEPEWPAVQKKAVELFGKTKDLRVAMILVRSLLATDGIKGLANGLTVVRGLLEQYWDGVHPQLDPEDDNDPGFRINSLAELVHPDWLAKVRIARFLEPTGRVVPPVNLREIAYALGLVQVPEGAQGFEKSTLDAVISDMGPEKVTAADKLLTDIRDHIAAIEGAFEERKPGQSPDLAPLGQIITWGKKGLAPYLESASESAPETTSENGATPDGHQAVGEGAAAPVRGGGVPGQIGSRADVIAAIDRICAYYERSEPTSPVPLLLARCKRLVVMSFLDIVRDIAPEALAHVELIVGKSNENQESAGS